MHLTPPSSLILAAALLIAAPAVLAQQQASPPQPQGQAMPATPGQADPRAQQPQSQPIVPQAGAQQPSPAQPQAEKKEEKKPAPAAKNSSNPRGTTRSMAFEVPPLVPIAEIPRDKAVTIQGTVLSPQATTFVLNDGNSSQVVVIGPTWRDLTKVKAGDRVRVIGQLDPYGASVFRAGSILLENNRIVVVPAG